VTIRQFGTRREALRTALIAATAAALTACATTIGGQPRIAPSVGPISPGHEVIGASASPLPVNTLTNSDGITPGAEITLPRPGREDGSCTVGFLVKLTDGRTGAMSAGHCQAKGGQAVLTATGRPIGQYLERTYQGDAPQHHDAALIVLDPGLVVDAWILNKTRVTSGVASAADLLGGRGGPATICWTGATTGGGNHCGPITNLDVENSKLTFLPDTQSTAGDSGGPVWAVWPDGGISAVGSLIGHSKSTGTVTASLLAPWMSAWHLKLAQT
jgi:hypothetical protein